MKSEKKYYHLLTKEEAEYAMSLPEHVFRRRYKEPNQCRYLDAMDRKFGCAWIFRDEDHRTEIVEQCKECPCGKIKRQHEALQQLG